MSQGKVKGKIRSTKNVVKLAEGFQRPGRT